MTKVPKVERLDMELERRTSGAGWRITWIPNQELLHQYWDKSGIYYLLCQPTRVGYIGSAKRFSQRLKSHFGDLGTNCHINKKMQVAFNQYGADSFTWGVIEECEIHKLEEREQYWVGRYTPDRLFNIELKVTRGQKDIIISREEAIQYALNYVGFELESVETDDGWYEWHLVTDENLKPQFMQWYVLSIKETTYLAGKFYRYGLPVIPIESPMEKVRREMIAKGWRPVDEF
jgi:hypothetical protein